MHKSVWLPVAYYVCFIIALAIFTRGFLPIKTTLKGYSPRPQTLDSGRPANPAFRKLIVMMIDALRHDFAFDTNVSQMHFLHELIRQGKALPFVAMASPPTVTMPRLKGLTTGSTPGFLDALLNFDAQSVLAIDSWIYQMRYNHNKTLVFYGDDTWLKLFPGDCFHPRSEGVSSFYVQDTVEVDKNVTRHLDVELNNGDWDALILHYLGLDHVGHIGGAKSPLMPGKQKEMDEIIEVIYQRYVEKHPETLFIVLGDHGMNELGNHGGSSYEEKAAAMSFINARFTATSERQHKPTTIEQIDLVPTLCELFNMAIPKNNLGVLIIKVIEMAIPEIDFQISAIQRNAEQIRKILVGEGKNSENFDNLFINATNARDNSSTLNLYYKFSRESSTVLSRSFSDYALDYMFGGLITMVICCVTIVFNFAKRTNILQFKVFATILMLYSFSIFASSFVEEEHEFWFYLTNSLWLIFGNHRKLGFATIVGLATNRLLYSWNAYGNKHISATDNVIHIVSRLYPMVQFYVMRLILVLILVSISLKRMEKMFKFLVSLIVLLVFIIKDYNGYVSEHHKNIVANWLYFMAFSILASRKLGRRPDASAVPIVILLLCIAVSKLANVMPLCLLYQLGKIMAENLSSDLLAITIFTQMQLGFFATGNSNSISTIDISNAYLGLGKTNLIMAGVLTFISTAAGPICVLTGAFSTTAIRSKVFQMYSVWSLGRVVSITALAISVTVLRYHLFIWSVFSPKFLYELAWMVFHFVIIPLLVFMAL